MRLQAQRDAKLLKFTLQRACTHNQKPRMRLLLHKCMKSGKQIGVIFLLMQTANSNKAKMLLGYTKCISQRIHIIFAKGFFKFICINAVWHSKQLPLAKSLFGNKCINCLLAYIGIKVR